MKETYKDTILVDQTNFKKFYRTFDYTIDPENLVWHRDHKNRVIQVIEGANWYLQFDNELPVELEVGKEYYIPKNHYHRIIKGSGNLILEIKE